MLTKERTQAINQRLFETSQDLILVTDGYGKLIAVSPSAAAILGYQPGEMIGRNGREFTYSEDLEPTRRQMQDARRGQATRFFTSRYRHKDGHAVVLEWMGTWSEADHHHFFVGRDVSEKIKLTARLDEEMSRLRAIIESSGALMVLTDRDRKIVMVNREFERLLGVSAGQVTGRPLIQFLEASLDPELYRRWRDQVLPVDQLLPAIYTKNIVDRAGKPHVFVMSATPIVDLTGRMRSIVYLGVDDTERRHAEDALINAERLVLLGEMAGTVAHEIAQPAQVINVAAAAALEEIRQATESGAAVDAQYLARRIERILQQVERASRILDDLRTFVRGNRRGSEAEFDPAAAVSGALDLVSHGMIQGRIELVAELPEKMPILFGFASRLEQVLVNLINNARDAGASRIVVRGGEREGPDGTAVWISVTDNGPGIPPDVLQRLFREFITTKPAGKGTGLGLKICRRIVEEMGGSITASNHPEGGAQFEIVMPSGRASAQDR